MTKPRISAMAASLIALVSSVLAFDSTAWKFCADVTIRDGPQKYARLTLTPDIYHSARADLGDIRLADSRGDEVAYVLTRPKDITDRLKYEPAVINRSTSTDRAAMVTLDFGKKVVKNSIEVTTAGDNFRRAVRIEGSNDNIEFFTLVGQAYVFAISRTSRFDKIDLPTNDYRYLRIRVRPMAEEEKSPVIEDVGAFRIDTKPAKRQPVELVQDEHSEDEKSASSVYIYDLSYRRLPISEIELNIADESFYRYVTVEGRDAATQKVRLDSEDNRQRFTEVQVRWERIIEDTIYRYAGPDGQKHEKLLLRVPSQRASYRYLKIAIRNYDDKPVNVESVSARMIAHELVFAAEQNIASILYVGSESARTPQYDLRHILGSPLQVEARTARLGGIMNNPLFRPGEQKPVPWTEKNKVWLLITMVAIVLVLGGVILRSFRSIQANQGQG